MLFKRIIIPPIVISSLVAPISPSFATPTGCTTPPPTERHYVGAYTQPGYVWGAIANIDTQYMDMCPGNSISGINQYALWVGVDDNGNGWVQTGYRRFSTYLVNHVYQEAYSKTQNYYAVVDGSEPDGTTVQPNGPNTYQVNLYWTGSSDTSAWYFYFNGQSQWGIPFNTLLIAPIQVQVEDENNNPGNQVAGTTSNPVNWGNVYYKTDLAGGSYSYGLLSQVVFDPAIPNGAFSSGPTSPTPFHSWSTWDYRYP